VQNEYITNAMAGNAFDEEKVIQNANDKGFFISNEVDTHLKTNSWMTTASIFNQIVMMIVSILGEGSSVTICRRMCGLTMLESTSSFGQSVTTFDTTIIRPARCLPQQLFARPSIESDTQHFMCLFIQSNNFIQGKLKDDQIKDLTNDILLNWDST
jgi:hypothetical protein